MKRQPLTNVHLVSNHCVYASRVFKQTAALAGSVFDRVDISADAWDVPGRYPDVEQLDERRELWRLTTVRSNALPRGGVFGIVKRAERIGRRIWHYRKRRVTVVTAHSIAALQRGTILKRLWQAKLVYDAHELETETNGLEKSLQHRFRKLEASLIRQCDAVVCVSPRIADWYADTYGITKPTIVRNIPDVDQQSTSLQAAGVRERLGIPPEATVFIYQGGLFRGRRIEQLLRVFQGLGRDRQLLLMGYGELESRVRAAAEVSPNIHFLEAAPPHEVLSITKCADVGIVGMERVSLSNYYSLPNKFFEYLLAGLPVIVPDFPEMAEVIRSSGAGWIAGEADDDWRQAIEVAGTIDRNRAVQRVEPLRRTLCWSNEAETLRGLYRKVIGKA
jgi:glycosyltransferase involved in cell wall biosynthesis